MLRTKVTILFKSTINLSKQSTYCDISLKKVYSNELYYTYGCPLMPSEKNCQNL